MTASSESRQPWLRRPTRERRSYSTKPSPSGSPGPSIQASAASTAAARNSNPSRSPVQTASSATSSSQSAVESTEPKYGVCGTARTAASSPRRSSCMILPGCSSRKALSTVPWWRARNETADRPQRWSSSSVSRPTKAISRPNGRREPGQAGERHPLPADDRREQAQVVLPAAQGAVQLVVVGEDVGRLGLPALVLVAKRADARVELAAGLARRLRADHLDVVPDDGAPAGRKVQAEARPPLLERLGVVVEADDRLARDIVETQVRERQGTVAGLGREARAAAPAAAAADLEQVGEVGVEVQVDDELDLALVVVAHPQQLVQAVGDEARAAHVHAGLRQRVPVRGARLEVGQLDRRRVPAVGARAEEYRLAAGDGELVAAEVARVAVVQPQHRVLGPGHLPELVRVQEEVAFLDGEPRRAAAAHHVALRARGGDDGLVRRALAAPAGCRSGCSWGALIASAVTSRARACRRPPEPTPPAGSYPVASRNSRMSAAPFVDEEAGRGRLRLAVAHRPAPAGAGQRLADRRRARGRPRACACAAA